MKSRFVFWLIILLTLVAIFVDLPWQFLGVPSNPVTNFIVEKFPLKLGLDLQGGSQLVLETKMDSIGQDDKDSALESARTVIERRVNLYGVSEAVVQSSKVGEQRRILVELPGLKDASEAAQLIGKTAQLEFREVPASPSGEASEAAFLAIFNATPTGLTGADLKRASATFNQAMTGRSGPVVQLEFTSEGSKKFADLTRRNVGKQIPIFLDDVPISAPVVNQEIIGGNAVIEGLSVEESKNLAIQLNAGALPVPIQIIEQRQIGPSLGQESINKSLIAGFIGLAIVMVYMALYYGLLGIIADIALIIYAAIVLMIFKTGLFVPQLVVTLTLAGIAGFILSVGMAVDANILIFERMKEELRWGKNKKTALELGFSRAWSSIWASNVSSLMTAAILYFFGTSLVKGFAVTLAIGVLVSMFTAIVVTRTILRIVIGNK
jgi:preprotein translocase subunit SecD